MKNTKKIEWNKADNIGAENGKAGGRRPGKTMGKLRGLLRLGLKQEPGIDGILVTVGLCVIALLLCVVMKDSLKVFIETIVGALTTEAQRILTGVTP